MNYKTFIGVDISKFKLDIAVIHKASKQIRQYECENKQDKIESLFTQLFDEFDVVKAEVLVIAENTGHYTNPLSWAMIKEGYNLWVECPNQMHKRQGIKRGKSDPIDAKRIAAYGKRYADQAKLSKVSSITIEELKYLTAERELYVKNLACFKGQLTDHEDFVKPKCFNGRKKRLKSTIKTLKEKIKAIEQEIDSLIQEDKNLRQQKVLLESVPGIGPQIAIYTIISTEAFTKFKDARSFACHAGVAPFQYNSGTSIRSRSRRSKQSDRKLASLLQLGAASMSRIEGELKRYYERKLSEGKSKMGTLNAIRNKLIHMMFAVIRDNRMYKKDYQATWV